MVSFGTRMDYHPKPAVTSAREARDALRELRRRLGLSQEAFARRFGTTLKTIQRYEGVLPPGVKACIKLAEFARASGQDDLVFVFYRTAFSALGTEGWFDEGARSAMLSLELSMVIKDLGRALSVLDVEKKDECIRQAISTLKRAEEKLPDEPGDQREAATPIEAVSAGVRSRGQPPAPRPRRKRRDRDGAH
jgi:transcriptional regulator with XRE-family HTH domain